MRRLLLLVLILGNIPLRGQQLTLPFFDDFSTPQVNLTHWIVGGVEQTNGKAILPPSLGVVTFDGRDARGVPYRQDRPEAVGPTDTLTIREMALETYSPRDSVFLRFFVQPNGQGEAPDPEDSLWVEAKTETGDWIRLWSIRGGLPTSDFISVAIPIQQDFFFFNGFQFRFRSSGRQSGPFDTWHVDYVYVAAQGTRAPIFYPDIALVESPTSLLKRYRGVPFRSFRQNPLLYLQDSVGVRVRNLREFTSFSQVTFSLKGPGLDQTFTPVDFQTIPGSGLLTLRYPRPSSWIPRSPGTYHYRVRLETPESAVPAVPDFTVNDAFDQSITIEDTWQYDDGSAEGGADIDRRLGQVALLFSMPASDTLGGVQMTFSPTFSSLQGRSLLVRVWEATPTGPGKLLYQEPLRLTSDSATVKFIFQQSTVVPAQFYVGWQRIAEQVVPVGLDKNSILPAGFIWSNTGLSWQTTPLAGALMIRAIMGQLGAAPSQVGQVTGVSPEHFPTVYPNPTDSWLYWTPTKGEFVIRDLSGRILQTGDAELGAWSTQHWSPGVYFLTIVTKSHTFTQKWVIDR